MKVFSNMYLLRNPQKLEASISNLIKPSSTRMYVPGGVLLSIILEANFTNRPNNSGIIYGVSQETIQSIVRSLREKSPNNTVVELKWYVSMQLPMVIY